MQRPKFFGGKSWSRDFWGWQGELPRRSESRERVLERGGSGRLRGFLFFGNWVGDGEKHCR
jgi:hypothetical protein